MAEEHGAVVRVLEELGVTPKGKVINYVKRENASLRFIAFADGGQLPEVLQGAFCSVHIARVHVASYLQSLAPTKAEKVTADKPAKVKAKK